MYQFGDVSSSLCIPCLPQGRFPSWGGFQTKLQLLTLPSDFQLPPKTAELLRNAHRPPCFLGVQETTEGEHTHCTSSKFCVRRKSSGCFQQGQLDTHISHTKSLGQDRTSTSELSPCPWGKNYSSSWLQLPIPTVQILSSNSLIPFSFLLCQRKKLLFRNKAADSTRTEKADKQRTQNIHARL